MTVQQFKKGDIVKRNVGHIIWEIQNGETKWIDIEPESVGKEFVIEYSYFEKYGGGEDDKNKYSLISLEDGGLSAWHSDLTFVREGGSVIWEQISETVKNRRERNTNMGYILQQLLFEEGRLNSESILFLFEKIGHQSKFFQNGEYSYLQSEWAHFYPLFFNIGIVNKQTMLEIASEPSFNKYKIQELWEEIQLYLPNLKIPEKNEFNQSEGT